MFYVQKWWVTIKHEVLLLDLISHRKMLYNIVDYCFEEFRIFMIAYLCRLYFLMQYGHNELYKYS